MSSPLPISSPLPMTSPPPMASPPPVLLSPEPMATPPLAEAHCSPQPQAHAQGKVSLEGDKFIEFLKDSSPIINFGRIETINLKISCSHKQPFMNGENNAHETNLEDGVQEEQVQESLTDLCM
ncbi:hypothetical protein NP233_g3736 [Leucocoprinus birnbaumii]|uniref:Uncharacterized protein n=1 Tax=Leucocoprinus birnbaumii TaxID=56174 RepID=A0AAD5VXF8_9AGAR|nr:hypothetical protein NP233_g3736 [Leucocoprinus birnbaumii]